jgi:hypothetical protein
MDAACGIVAIGCGSSSTSNSPEDGGGSDATAESGQVGTDSGEQDVAQQPDVGPDSTGLDAGGVDGDATVTLEAEASPEGDSANGDVDAGPQVDAPGEADADAGSQTDAPVGDADAAGNEETGADADAGPVADAGSDADASALTAETFPSMVAAALCTTIASCCGTTGDAGNFNWQSCYNASLPSGFKGSSVGAALVSGGNVTFNSSQAQFCLSGIVAADCSANEITSAEQIQLFNSCFGAYVGTLEAGAPCAGSIECASGEYCSPVDGGVGDAGAIGLCQPLAGVGNGCGALGGASGSATNAQNACSYRGAASNGLFCQNISGDAGTTQLPESQWTCEPQWANGSDCYTNQDCTSMICHQVGSGFQCANAGNWANSNTCATYVTPTDAGGGG